MYSYFIPSVYIPWGGTSHSSHVDWLSASEVFAHRWILWIQDGSLRSRPWRAMPSVMTSRLQTWNMAHRSSGFTFERWKMVVFHSYASLLSWLYYQGIPEVHFRDDRCSFQSQHKGQFPAFQQWRWSCRDLARVLPRYWIPSNDWHVHVFSEVK